MQNKIEPIHVATQDEELPLPPPERLPVLLYWALITTVGLFVFSLYYRLLLADRLTAALSGPAGQSAAANWLALLPVLLPLGVALGFIMGLAQWFMLRRYVKTDYGWIALTILGWTLAYGLSLGFVSAAGLSQAVGVLGDSSTQLPLAVVRGLVVGACQWLALRGWGKPALLWIGVVVAAQVANLAVASWLSALPMAPAVGWVANGLVAGAGMVFLIHTCWVGLRARGLVVE